MVFGGFTTCAACHEAEIGDAVGGTSELVFLAPPEMDLEALAGVGDWPEYAEAQPNEFLMLMLEAGAYLDAGDREIVAGLELYDLLEASDEEKQAAGRLAWAFKSLIHDLVANGPAAFVTAVMDSHGDRKDTPAWADLAGSLPFDVIDKASREWFPDLATELRRHGQGEELPTNPVDPYADAEEGERDMDEWLRYGGWRRGYLSLVYRPSGHADRFLRGWLELSDTSAKPGAQSLFRLLADEDTPGRCAKCHVSGDVAPRLRWSARGTAGADPRRLADGSGTMALRRHVKSFSHFTHQQAIVDGGCGICHAVVSDGQNTTPAGFAGVSPEGCRSCHRQETGLSSCLTCHDYHFFRPLDDRLLRKGGVFAAVDR